MYGFHSKLLYRRIQCSTSLFVALENNDKISLTCDDGYQNASESKIEYFASRGTFSPFHFFHCPPAVKYV